MTSAFHLYVGLLGLVSFILSPVISQDVDVQSSLTCGTVTTTITISVAGEKPSPLIPIPIEPPGSPAPTRLPEPTGTSMPINTGLNYKIDAGQPFSLYMVNLMSIFGGDPRVDTIPQVNWVYVDRERVALSGKVPADYPAGPITVILTGQYVSNLVMSLTLDVRRPVSSTSTRRDPVYAS